MKKLLCIVLTVVLFSLSMSGVYAKGRDDKGGRSSYVNRDDSIDNLYSRDAKYLKEQLKKYHKDEQKRKQLLKQISNLEKKNRKNFMQVYVNGVEVDNTWLPVIKYGRVLIPVAPLVKALGADLKWDQSTGTITITKDDMIIVMKAGSRTITVNDEEVQLEVAPETINNRVYVPISFIKEILKERYELDEDSDSIIIEDGQDGQEPPTDPGQTTNPPPTAVTATVNDNITGTSNNQVEYANNWSYVYQAGAYLNDIHSTSTTDAYCQVRFYGKQIKLYGSKDSGSGIAAASIDSIIETNFDTYAASRTDNTLLYASPVLSIGQHTLKIRVTGTKNSSSSSYAIMVDRFDILAEGSTANLALNKTAAALSYDDGTRSADKAVDGKTDTCWYSQYSDPQWIYVDLGSAQNVSRVRLNWETAYGKGYKIQASSDLTNWTDVYSTTTGDGGIDDISFTTVSARYIRMYGLQRATQWGYSLKEFEIYN